MHISSGLAPQTVQEDSFPLFKIGLLLAQVPANLPSFFAHIFIAIPATPKARRPIVSNTNFHIINCNRLKDKINVFLINLYNNAYESLDLSIFVT